MEKDKLSRLSMSADEFSHDSYLLFDKGFGEETEPSHIDEKGKKQLRHFQLPNFASVLPDYSNIEQDYIKSAFERGNFSTIAGIPTHLRPGEMARARTRHIENNRKSNYSVVSSQVLKARPKLTKNGLFSEFMYMPSRYSLADELKKKERLEADAKRLEIGNRDFVCSSDRTKQKYEDGFENKEYTYPYMGDAFEAAQDQALRTKWINETKVLHGPFRPSGTQKSLSLPNRSSLNNILQSIQNVLTEDWDEGTFNVVATEDDHLVIRFELMHLESESALLAYMNVFISSNYVVDKFKLIKVVEHWAERPGDGFLYFMFRPPWVRAAIIDTYLALHPEKRRFKTSKMKSSAAAIDTESKK